MSRKIGSNSERPAIRDYAIIGDCHSAALVAHNGSLDWLCWPRFDSPAIFAALLDPIRGGHWRIAPPPPFSVRRRYMDNTNILQTFFHTSSGSGVLTDVMPISSEEHKCSTFTPDHHLVRELECTSGTLAIDLDFFPRSDFGIGPAKLRDRGKLGIEVTCGRCVCWLRSNIQISLRDGRGQARFVLREGEVAQFSFTYSEDAPAVLPPLGESLRDSISRSAEWWQQWTGRAKYDGPFREAVIRSALALKLLAYSPSGAIVAAATTSLPERIGGDLNWDYRFCWLRDASLTIRALLGLGYFEEAADFMEWMLIATRLTRPELKIMYEVYGETAPRERTLEHLSGYRDSKPVRVGNGARHQLQLDVYGEVIDAAAQYCFHGGRFDREMQKVLVGFGNYVLKHWDSPDEGIWEPRSGRRNHTHSRLLCWTALDRLLGLSEKGLVRNVPVEKYRRAHDAIRKQICDRAWNSQLQSYVGTLDGGDLDASLLLLCWYGFEKPDSSRMKSTYHRLREQLGAGNRLIHRYSSTPGEGAFAICSFWEAEYLALGGSSLHEAESLFRHLLSYRNDLDLYAEEIDPVSGDALGNFPQAFTHVGLISAALSLHARVQGAEQLPHRRKDAGQSDEVEATA